MDTSVNHFDYAEDYCFVKFGSDYDVEKKHRWSGT